MYKVNFYKALLHRDLEYPIPELCDEKREGVPAHTGSTAVQCYIYIHVAAAVYPD